MDNLTIVHSNDLVESCYSLNATEMRLISFAATKIDSRLKKRDVVISVAEYIEVFSLQRSSNIYADLRKAVKSLMRSPVMIRKGDWTTEIAWLAKNNYSVKDGAAEITLKFGEDISEFIFELKERFTVLNFENVAKLNTSASWRIYQWLVEHKAFKKSQKEDDLLVIELELSWIKERLALQNKYNRWDVFRAKVLEPALQKINVETDLSVTWQAVKRGRNVVAIQFAYIVDKNNSSHAKPQRPRLFRRPEVSKNSNAEGEWMYKNLNLLRKYEQELKAYDSSLKLDLADVRKMIEYAKGLGDKFLQKDLERQVKIRTAKKEKQLDFF